jgi:hypothetical protein
MVIPSPLEYLMDIITLLGVICIVLAICCLVGVVGGGIVAAIILGILGLIILGGGLGVGRRGRL